MRASPKAAELGGSPVALSTEPVLTDAPVATETGGARPHWIDDWRPEDPVFWEATGKRIARRNLVFSIFSEHIGFSVWTMWSVFVLFLGPEYGFDPGQRFLMTTLPAAAGSLLRLPYTFAVAKIGGRNWTIISSLLLLIPCFMAAAVIEPGVSFSTMLIIATFAGVGGGNFSSSMSNIETFYPQRLKGWALGLNAGGGNIGVPVVQLIGLAVIGASGGPRVLLGIYIPFIVNQANYAGDWARWYNSRGADGERPPDDVVRKLEIYREEVLTAPDPDERDERFREVLAMS
jgi:MFS transporter, NNP family, nitrate/nitrite transporter